MLWRERLDAALQVFRQVDQLASLTDDSDVRGAEMLSPALHDAAHAIRHGHVLLARHANAGKVDRLLHLAAERIVVIAIPAGPPAIDQSAAARKLEDGLVHTVRIVQLSRAFLLVERALRMVGISERHAMLIVDGYPAVSHRGMIWRRDHTEDGL